MFTLQPLMKSPLRNTLLLSILLSLLSACSAVKPPQQVHLEAADTGLRDCAHWFNRLDDAVERSGVGDFGARRVEGFPYLRVDRFSVAFRAAVPEDARVGEALVERMRGLDSIGRGFEIANLPQAEVAVLDADRAELSRRLQRCAERLASADFAGEPVPQALLQRLRVDDDYSNTARAIGLYELTRLPFHAGVRAWQDRARETIERTREGEPPQQPLSRYRPPAISTYTREQVTTLLAEAADHPLGILEPSREQFDRLFATYAPVLEIETGDDYDRFGRPVWGEDGLPWIDTDIPTLYRRLEHTRVGGRTLVQLVYVAWFPERPREQSFDLLAGRLDGLVWRVTLAADGAPVLFDSIHPCGCYHQFIPTPRAQPIPAPEGAGEWAFVPADLPDVRPDQRVVVGLQTRTRYLRDVRTSTDRSGQSYQFADYDELRSLPLPEGGRRSLFGADGLVPGTERGERYFFWPMGISSAGAMRQAGSQATAFVGRRHFDDPDLIEKRFRLLD